MMAAALADGVTTLDNAAREPEIVDLAACLVAMGARISGAGSDRIVIEGVPRLHGATPRDHAGSHRDRHVPRRGGRDARRRRRSPAPAPTRSAPSSTSCAKPARAIDADGDAIRVRGNGALRAANVRTAPFPAFPTDMQAQFMALATPRRRRVGDHRDDLREPDDARAGAEAPRRRHRGRRQCGDRARRRARSPART